MMTMTLKTRQTRIRFAAQRSAGEAEVAKTMNVMSQVRMDLWRSARQLLREHTSNVGLSESCEHDCGAAHMCAGRDGDRS